MTGLGVRGTGKLLSLCGKTNGVFPHQRSEGRVGRDELWGYWRLVAMECQNAGGSTSVQRPTTSDLGSCSRSCNPVEFSLCRILCGGGGSRTCPHPRREAKRRRESSSKQVGDWQRWSVGRHLTDEGGKQGSWETWKHLPKSWS
jgi:hypothetical protein